MCFEMWIKLEKIYYVNLDRKEKYDGGVCLVLNCLLGVVGL